MTSLAFKMRSAVRDGDEKRLRYFWEGGGDEVDEYPNGETPVFTAVFAGRPAMVSLLLSPEYGFDPEARKGNGATALHWAVGVNSPRMVRLLLAAGGDVHARDNEGYAPEGYIGRFGAVPDDDAATHTIAYLLWE